MLKSCNNVRRCTTQKLQNKKIHALHNRGTTNNLKKKFTTNSLALKFPKKTIGFKINPFSHNPEKGQKKNGLLFFYNNLKTNTNNIFKMQSRDLLLNNNTNLKVKVQSFHTGIFFKLREKIPKVSLFSTTLNPALVNKKPLISTNELFSQKNLLLPHYSSSLFGNKNTLVTIAGSESLFVKQAFNTIAGQTKIPPKEATNNQALDLYNTGNFYQASHQYLASQDCYLQAMKILEQGTSNLALGHCHFQLGKVLGFQKSTDAAIEHLKKASAIYQEKGAKEDLILCYQMLGQIYFEMNQINQSIDIFQKALTVIRNPPLNKIDIEADICYSLGRCHTTIENHQLAIEFLTESLKMYEKLNDVKGLGNCYYYIGCNQKEDFDLALESFKQALSYRKQIYGTHHTLISDCYRKMGNVYTKKGEFDTALDYYFGSVNSEKVLIETYPKRADFHKHRKAVCYYKLGLSKELKGDMKNAEHYYLKALRAFPNSEQERFPDVLLKLSQFYRARGRTHEAEEYFGRAIDWYRNHNLDKLADMIYQKREENFEVEVTDDFESSQLGSPSYFL